MSGSKKIISILDDEFIKKYKLANDLVGKSIVLYKDRVTHIEKHKSDFSSPISYFNSLTNIEDIIKFPEFVSFDTKNNSLEFVKRIDENTLVAVRVSKSKELKIRTMYPISETKKSKIKAKS